MKVTKTKQENVITVSFALTDKENQILEYVKEKGFIEFRTNYEEENHLDDSNQFKESEIKDLIQYEFLIPDYEAWHRSYVLGEMAKL